MTKLPVYYAFLFSNALCLGQSISTIKQDKWIDLFNGKDLNNWSVKITDRPLNDNQGNTFRVENGRLVVLTTITKRLRNSTATFFIKSRLLPTC